MVIFAGYGRSVDVDELDCLDEVAAFQSIKSPFFNKEPEYLNIGGYHVYPPVFTQLPWTRWSGLSMEEQESQFLATEIESR